MKELTIVSGKGGTGKTSITASFAALAENKVLVDADVDAADLHLIVSPTIKKEEIFKGGHKALINHDICTQCGECTALCQFKAINSDFVIDPIDCEGCGVCVHFCPVQAIDFQERICGKWYISETKMGPMVHARLGIAEENSGLLVSLIRKQAKILAENQGIETIIIDGPPGIGCPVIAAVTGTDAILIVTEPTLSGLHDFERVGKLAYFLKVPAMVCINKSDLNPELSKEIKRISEKNNIKYMGTIPYDREITYAMVAGKSLVEFSQGTASEAIKELWEKTKDFLSKTKSRAVSICQSCQANQECQMDKAA